MAPPISSRDYPAIGCANLRRTKIAHVQRQYRQQTEENANSGRQSKCFPNVSLEVQAPKNKKELHLRKAV
jgi:hypothetical protein